LRIVSLASGPKRSRLRMRSDGLAVVDHSRFCICDRK